MNFIKIYVLNLQVVPFSQPFQVHGQEQDDLCVELVVLDVDVERPRVEVGQGLGRSLKVPGSCGEIADEDEAIVEVLPSTKTRLLKIVFMSR